MFRVKKLRPDWNVKNYVIPISRIESGDEFWTEARTLKNAWNEIVAAYRGFDEQVATLEAKLAELKKEKLDVNEVKETLSRISKERKEKTLTTWKAQSPNVYNNDLENLQTAANGAISSAYKNRGTLHFKHGIQAVNFCKRFGAGGVKFAELLTELDSRHKDLRRKPIAMRIGEKRESNRSRNKTLLHGHYLVGKRRVPVKFTGVWSYPCFPETAFVKKIMLVGKFSTLKNWQWSFIVTVEEPPIEDLRPAALPVAALDLGYRRFDDYIRFGFIVDSLGNKFELRLPHGNMISSYLKNTIKFLAEKGVEKHYIKDLKDLFVWDASQDASLEDAKKQLKALSDHAKIQGNQLPEEWRITFAGFTKMRNRGLLKLKKISNEILNGEEKISEEVQNFFKQTTEIIDRWHEKDVYFETEKDHFRRKFLGRRKLLYRQTVKWLVSNYSRVIWKEDLKLGVIATKAKKSSRITGAALKESSKFRQWTGLSQLRLFIKEQSSKMPEWLRAGTTAYSTQVCDECGAETVSDRVKLILVCANGHKKDQDERAATNLLKEAMSEINDSPIPVNIPAHLTNYIVRIV